MNFKESAFPIFVILQLSGSQQLQLPAFLSQYKTGIGGSFSAKSCPPMPVASPSMYLFADMG